MFFRGHWWVHLNKMFVPQPLFYQSLKIYDSGFEVMVMNTNMVLTFLIEFAFESILACN